VSRRLFANFARPHLESSILNAETILREMKQLCVNAELKEYAYV
jgi:hypothetical protein